MEKRTNEKEKLKREAKKKAVQLKRRRRNILLVMARSR